MSQKSGSIELRSGRWDWSLEGASTGGAILTLRHRWRFQDRITSWMEGVAAETAEILEAARDPVLREWVDGDGLLWRVSIEIPSLNRGDDLTGDLLLVFSRGGFRRVVRVPATLALGELTNAELQERLREACSG